jgi:hypothetical protein
MLNPLLKMEEFHPLPNKPLPYLMVLLLQMFLELQVMERLFHIQFCHQPAQATFHLQPHTVTTELHTPTHMLQPAMAMRLLPM